MRAVRLAQRLDSRAIASSKGNSIGEPRSVWSSKCEIQDTIGGKITAKKEYLNFSRAEEREKARASARRQLLGRRIARVKEAASDGAREEEREAAGASGRQTTGMWRRLTPEWQA